MENFDELLKCPVCLERITLPIKVCLRHHVICKDTCGRLLNECPMCRGEFLTDQNVPVFIKNIIEASPAACKNAEHGCPKLMSKKDLLEHENICDFRLIKCFRSTCGTNNEYVYCKFDHQHLISKHSNDSCKTTFDKFKEIELKPLSHFPTFRSWIFMETSTNKFFLLRYYISPERILYISMQYTSKRENAKKYLYEITFSQGQSFRLTLGNYCAPRFDSSNEIMKHENGVSFNMNQCFFYEKDPESLKVRVRISKNQFFRRN